MRAAFWSFLCIAFVAVYAQNAAPKSDNPPRLLWQLETRGCALSEPTIHGNLVFIGSCTGKFYAVEKNSGKEKWTYDTHADGASGEFRTAPIVHNAIVFAATEGKCPDGEGYLYAFDQNTGKIHWKLPAAVTSSNFILLGNTVVFGTRKGGLSVDLESGQRKWGFEVPTTPPNCKAQTSIATDGTNVYLLAADGVIYALEGTSGRQLWKQPPPSTVTTQLLVYKDVLYFGVSGEVESLSIADGQSLGRLKVPATPVGAFAWHHRGETDFAYSYGTLNSQAKGSLLAYSDEFEGVIWSHETNEPWTSGAPLPWKGVVVAGNCHGDIRAYEGRKGVLEWKAEVKGCISGIAHDETTLYVLVKEGVLYVLRPAVK